MCVVFQVQSLHAQSSLGNFVPSVSAMFATKSGEHSPSMVVTAGGGAAVVLACDGSDGSLGGAAAEDPIMEKLEEELAAGALSAMMAADSVESRSRSRSPYNSPSRGCQGSLLQVRGAYSSPGRGCQVHRSGARSSPSRGCACVQFPKAGLSYVRRAYNPPTPTPGLSSYTVGPLQLATTGL